MAIKPKYVQVRLTEYHHAKLNIMCKQTGLTKTGIIQRAIEDYKLLGFTEEEIKEEMEKES